MYARQGSYFRFGFPEEDFFLFLTEGNASFFAGGWLQCECKDETSSEELLGEKDIFLKCGLRSIREDFGQGSRVRLRKDRSQLSCLDIDFVRRRSRCVCV